MGIVIQEFQKIQLENLQSPNNYSMSGLKIAFILLVITMISASASAGCAPGYKICLPDLGICMDMNLLGRSTDDCKQRLEDCGSDVSCITKVLLECAGIG